MRACRARDDIRRLGTTFQQDAMVTHRYSPLRVRAGRDGGCFSESARITAASVFLSK